MGGSALGWSTFGAAVVAATAVFIQVRIANKDRRGTNLLEAIRLLQSPQMRKSRRVLYWLDEHERSWEQLRENQEVLDQVEEVGQILDVVGLMHRTGMLPRKDFIENWDFMIVKCWFRLQPWVEHRRDREANPDLWKEFETLAGRARKSIERREGGSAILEQAAS